MNKLTRRFHRIMATVSCTGQWPRVILVPSTEVGTAAVQPNGHIFMNEGWSARLPNKVFAGAVLHEAQHAATLPRATAAPALWDFTPPPTTNKFEGLSVEEIRQQLDRG